MLTFVPVQGEGGEGKEERGRGERTMLEEAAVHKDAGTDTYYTHTNAQCQGYLLYTLHNTCRILEFHSYTNV